MEKLYLRGEIAWNSALYQAILPAGAMITGRR
jgi:hypothetical protein